jgi:acyl carrier protein
VPFTTKNEIRAEIISTLQETFEIAPIRLVPNANLYTDLEIDSIDAIDLMLSLQKRIGKRIQPDQFKNVRTIEDVVTVVEKLIAE